MSALIKIKELVVDDHLILYKLQNTILIIPFIKSFIDTVYEKEIFITPSRFNILKLDKEKLTDDEKFYGVKIKIYVVEYKDTTSEYSKLLNFLELEDAEKFLYELKSCINEFYNNAEEYIKFIN